jgi:hypothetical protein
VADTECRVVGHKTDATGQMLLGFAPESEAPAAAGLGVANGFAVVLEEALTHL